MAVGALAGYGILQVWWYTETAASNSTSTDHDINAVQCAKALVGGRKKKCDKCGGELSEVPEHKVAGLAASDPCSAVEKVPYTCSQNEKHP